MLHLWAPLFFVCWDCRLYLGIPAVIYFHSNIYLRSECDAMQWNDPEIFTSEECGNHDQFAVYQTPKKKERNSESKNCSIDCGKTWKSGYVRNNLIQHTPGGPTAHTICGMSCLYWFWSHEPPKVPVGRPCGAIFLRILISICTARDFLFQDVHSETVPPPGRVPCAARKCI